LQVLFRFFQSFGDVRHEANFLRMLSDKGSQDQIEGEVCSILCGIAIRLNP